MNAKTPLPQSFDRLPPNRVIQRCSTCHTLVFADEQCKTQNDLNVCDPYFKKFAIKPN